MEPHQAAAYPDAEAGEPARATADGRARPIERHPVGAARQGSVE